MVYSCKECRYLFESENVPERCPDCGKPNVAYANAEEIEEYNSYKALRESVNKETAL